MPDLSALPGFRAWGGALEALRAHPGPLWIHGEAGCGVSTLGTWLARERGTAFLDDAERADPDVRSAFLAANPRAVLASHLGLEHPDVARDAEACLAFRIPALDETPQDVMGCLAALAREEGVEGPLPPALALLPCPGNLRGLRNRLVRWKLLGQLPVEAPQSLPLPDSENLASNLHLLERLLLHRALRRSYGNRVEAAKRLGVSRRHLYLLIARHGDPVRGEAPTREGPKRLRKRQISFPDGPIR
jgi:hypothetical protein